MTPPRPARAPRRALVVALCSGALGAASVLVAAGQTWGEAAVRFAGGELRVEVTGSEVSGLPSALALVGLAALVAVFAVRRASRGVVAALLALCGVGTAAAAVWGAADTSALETKAAEATGLADGALGPAAHTGWPWLAVAGGILLLLAGVLALSHGPHWPAMSGRYERSSAPSPATRPAAGRPEELWKALDRGEDPTREERS